MNILSVDWDFFFPDTGPFDWGHREAAFFLEDVWWLRCSSRNLFTGERAIDVFWPDRQLLDGFWDKVCPTNPKILAITESHLDLFYVLRNLPGGSLTIYNFDQHCDLGDTDAEPDCGNWASHALDMGANIVQIYPEWRKHRPEKPEDGEAERTTVHYEIPPVLPRFGRPLSADPQPGPRRGRIICGLTSSRVSREIPFFGKHG